MAGEAMMQVRLSRKSQHGDKAMTHPNSRSSTCPHCCAALQPGAKGCPLCGAWHGHLSNRTTELLNSLVSAAGFAAGGSASAIALFHLDRARSLPQLLLLLGLCAFAALCATCVLQGWINRLWPKRWQRGHGRAGTLVADRSLEVEHAP